MQEKSTHDARHGARRLLTPSARSDVPPFMVMDVMAAAARIEARGGHVMHMEVGQPAAPAPRTAIAAAQAALERAASATPRRSAFRRCARASRGTIARPTAVTVEPERIVVTTGSSAGFILAFLALFEPGDRVAVAVPGLSAVPAYSDRARLRAGADRDIGDDALGADRRALLAAHRRTPLKGVLVASPANPTGTMMRARRSAELIAAAEGEGIRFISDEIYHGLDYAFPAETAAKLLRRRRHHQFVLEIFLHDRLARRLDGGAGGAGAPGRAAAAESRDLGADAVADRGRGRVRRRGEMEASSTAMRRTAAS